MFAPEEMAHLYTKLMILLYDPEHLNNQ